MQNFLELALPYILDIIATLVISGIGVAGAWMCAKIAKNKQLSNIGAAVNQVVQAAQLTVGELQQTTVHALKEAAPNGKLSDEQVASLKRTLLQKTSEKLSAPVVQLLEASKTDVNAIITGAAEDLINSIHMV